MPQAMTIVSLEQTATEWLAAIGAAYVDMPSPDALAGFPGRADLIVVSKADEEPVRDMLAAGAAETEVLIFEPRTIKQVLDAVLQLARSAGRLREAMRLIGDGEARLQRLRRAIGATPGDTPVIAVLTGLDPIEIADGWLHDAVALAGGRPVATLDEADAVILALPDAGVEEAQIRVAAADLPGVARERMWVIDGSRYATRPGPSLYRTVELIAIALHRRRLGIEVADDELRPTWIQVPAA